MISVGTSYLVSGSSRTGRPVLRYGKRPLFLTGKCFLLLSPLMSRNAPNPEFGYFIYKTDLFVI